MINDTIRKFGYPDTLVEEYEHWVVLIRPAQVTVGSLVLAAKSDAVHFPDLPAEAFQELQQVTGHLEEALAGAFRYDKLNYLMLMMVDPHVHYHVIPRYAEPVAIGERAYPDEHWPGPPDVTRSLGLQEAEFAALRNKIKATWPS